MGPAPLRKKKFSDREKVLVVPLAETVDPSDNGDRLRALERNQWIIPMQVYRGRLETDPDKFNGKVWLKRFPDLVTTEARVLALHFERGSWTNWHVHTGRQVMYGIHGIGCVVEQGGQATAIFPGDVVYLEPGVTHWHGAAPDGGDFIHTVVAFDRKTFWKFRQENGELDYQLVSAEDYRKTWDRIKNLLGHQS